MKFNKVYKIFILEDDVWYGTMLEHFLSLNPDFEIQKFDNQKEFFENLYQNPDVVTLDFGLKDTTGREVLKKIKTINPEIDVIMISGQDDVSTAIELLKIGAFDYIVKDEETQDRLWTVLNHLREIKGLKKEVETLKTELKKTFDFNKVIIGQSDSVKKVFSLIEKAAGTNITVSITGETGTGKEMVAKAIHYNSSRYKHPFVAINVAALPKDLLESELFGHEKGAFTGAVAGRAGKFEEANKGTLFLDEIGEMDIHLQAKLLRVLQEREICRIGSNTVVPIDVRIIIATHKDLRAEAENKNFREDLYYRLLGLPIHLPPLRERGNDILVLAKHFINLFCTENRTPLKNLSLDAQQKLLSYHFPGNIRELRSIIELSVVMSDSLLIEAKDININTKGSLNRVLNNEETTLREYETGIIKHFLEKYNNDVILVAKKLDVGKSTIYRMIQTGEISLK